MRTKFTNKELPHIWMSESQPEGRGNNLYFDGPTIYSYGPHFPIARIFHFEDHPTHPRAGAVVLFTSKSYNTTTAKHKSQTRQAVNGFLLEVPDVNAQDHAGNVRYLVQGHADALGKAKRARTHAALHYRRAGEIADALNWYNVYFLPPAFADECPELQAAVNAAVRWYFSDFQREMPRIRAEADEAEAKANERRAADAAARLDRWKAGETVSTADFGLLTVALRIETRGLDGPPAVVSSWGASVDLEEARRAYDIARFGDLQPGAKVGPYTVEDVNDYAVKVGCHVLPRDELNRVFA